MPKPKALGKPSKKNSKKQPQEPETADDFLAAGVELEEAAEKWRGGDAVKSARFYQKALANYDAGLALFPNAFDLAYNKARIQYAVTQHPLLRNQFPSPTPDLLQAALDSHRRALQLQPEIPDVLFNTAQVLSSLADHLLDGPAVSRGNRAAALGFLGEATSMLQSCVTLQEQAYARSQSEPFNAVDDAAADDVADQASAAEPVEPDADNDDAEAWASIEAPVTPETLVETAVALLQVLGTVCEALDETSANGLESAERTADSLLRNTMPQYLEKVVDDNSKVELHEAEVEFKAAWLESAFTLHVIDVETYDQQLKNSLDALDKAVLTANASLLCACAQALVDFSNATNGIPKLSGTRWSRLSKALDLFTEASKYSSTPNLHAIHESRGDTELLRLSLCSDPDLPSNLRDEQVQRTLLNNAEKYYRGAASIARNATRDPKVVASLSVKEAIIASLAKGDNSPVVQLQNNGIALSDMTEVVAEMQDEGLVSQEALRRCGLV